MKFTAILSSLLYSSFVLAGNLYAIKNLTYDVTRSQKPNEIIFCQQVDTDHNLVSACHNLNLLKNYSVESNATGEVVLTSKINGNSMKVGSLNKTKQFQLDDMDKATLAEVTVNEQSQFEVNLLSKTGVVLNRDIGCKAPFECDWNIFTTDTKLSLEVKLEGSRLEKVKLY